MKAVLILILMSAALVPTYAQKHKLVSAKVETVNHAFDRLKAFYKLGTDFNDNAVANLCTILTVNPVCDMLEAKSLNEGEDYELSLIKGKYELDKYLDEHHIDKPKFYSALRRDMANGRIKNLLDSWSKANTPGPTMKQGSKEDRILIVD